jgi:ATP phosphoribosyltransferase
LLTSSPVLVANPEAWGDEWRQAKSRQIGVLVKGALDAEGRVGIKMNVPLDHVEAVIELLPSITAPTVSPLYPSPNLQGKEWCAVETVIAERTVRELFPKLLEAGAVGIIEFPLNKII